MGDAWTSATPLRNADFRALLTTPRPSHAQQGTPRQRPKPQKHSDAADGEKQQKFRKPHLKARLGKPTEAKDKEKDDAAKYRDRAKERREGVNIDFVDPAQELAARGLKPEALQNLSIEQSKFLGGDIAHTHLVKGLDYALLHQNRQKLESDATRPSSDAAAAAKAAALQPRSVSKEQMHFEGSFGRAVFGALFRPPQTNKVLIREMFQPRRTAFVFEFAEGSGDIPTTLRRSKADCPPVQDLVSAAADASLLERISKIISYIHSSGAGKSGKRSDRDSQYIRSLLAGVNPAAPGYAQVHGQLVVKGQAAIAAGKADGPAAAAAAAAANGTNEAAGADDEDDIFGDAGSDYVPALPHKREGQERRPEGGYFDSNEHLADLRQQSAPAAAAEHDIDMEIEEGEVPHAKQRTQHAAVAAFPPPPGQQDGGRYEGYEATEQEADDEEQGGYYQQQQYQQQQEQQYQQQQAGWQQQGYYGQQQYSQYTPYEQAAAQEPVPKWRVTGKPGAELKGFADEAYAEFFPSMVEFGVAEDDDEAADTKAAATGGPAGAAGPGAGGRGGQGAGGRGGRGGGGGLDDTERRMSHKLSKEVQQMQGIFKEKGWGSEMAFRKQEKDRFDAMAATPARKRIRL